MINLTTFLRFVGSNLNKFFGVLFTISKQIIQTYNKL